MVGSCAGIFLAPAQSYLLVLPIPTNIRESLLDNCCLFRTLSIYQQHSHLAKVISVHPRIGNILGLPLSLTQPEPKTRHPTVVIDAALATSRQGVIWGGGGRGGHEHH